MSHPRDSVSPLLCDMGKVSWSGGDSSPHLPITHLVPPPLPPSASRMHHVQEERALWAEGWASITPGFTLTTLGHGCCSRLGFTDGETEPSRNRITHPVSRARDAWAKGRHSWVNPGQGWARFFYKK